MRHLFRKLRQELKVNTTCGASNISFGLPNRHGINKAFLPMIIGAGMTSAIVNPLHEGFTECVKAADVLVGNDADYVKWIKAYRKPQAGGNDERSARRIRLRD